MGRKSGQFIFIFVFSILLFAPTISKAAVIINEIAWMGGVNSSADEWIELFNPDSQAVNLDGWRLTAQDGQPNIQLSGVLPAQGYFLLERSDDNSVPNKPADLIYSGALSNGGETLELKDASGKTVDRLDASDGWPAGDNTAKKTLERSPGGDWQTSAVAGGTPKAPNSHSSLPFPPSSYSSPAPSLLAGTILINEFVSNPDDGEVEWVELINLNPNPVNLAGWYLQEGGGEKTWITATIGNQENNFLTIKNIKGYLNNNGDIISLYTPKGELVDQVVYGQWQTGPNNAPAPPQAASVARFPDGQNSQNWRQDFQITTTPTPSLPNLITYPEPSKAEETPTNLTTHPLIITEILPNPEGVDYEGEFIEIYNRSVQKVDLSGWSIEDASGKKFVMFSQDSFFLNSGQYWTIFRPQSGIILNNSADSLRLCSPQRQCHVLEYQNAPEAKSYNRLNPASEEWQWSQIITPSQPNKLPLRNHSPQADFSVSRLRCVGQPVVFDGSDSVDPDGDDLNFLWDFDDGFTNRLVQPAHTFWQEGEYKIILQVDDGQATATQERVISVQRCGGSSSKALLSAPKEMETDTAASSLHPLPKESEPSTELKNSASLSIAFSVPDSHIEYDSQYPLLAGEEVPFLQKGDCFSVIGQAVSLPGQIASRYFYLAFAAGGGIQVYSHKKDFPFFKEGTEMAVRGCLSWVRGEPRLKTKKASDIKILSQSKPLSPAELEILEIDDSWHGHLVQVQGKVTKKKANNFIISNEEELAVYLPTRLSLPSVNVSDLVQARGVLVFNQKGGKLVLLRSQDIVVLAQASSTPKVLGAATQAKESWILPDRPRPQWQWYGAGLILLLGGTVTAFILHKKRQSQETAFKQ
ncbi:PKD domain-containing protein [Candidatus Parcubacteria bacterium]|nr:MAG: PKD domain-containing protein [Candidatus Parcubacteria bacterium]